MTTLPSSIVDLNQAIESQNPFDNRTVRSHDVWKQGFPDVPSINAHAYDAVFQAIKEIRVGQRSVIGITIRAERGLGKSHLISRIRHCLLDESGFFFVYMSEVDYGDLNRINSNFLNTLAFSLKQTGNLGVMQWQELATALVNQITNKSYTPQHLISRFSGALAQNPKLVDGLTAKVLQVKPNIDNPYIIQAILWTLSSDKVTFAINWLSGKALANSQADAMGLPSRTEDDKEAEALRAACQILDLIGDYRTLVICFDELEPKNCNEQGLLTPQVVALLAKDLYSKIKRGVLIMAMFPVTWRDYIRTLPRAESVTDRIAEKIFDLNPLNAENVVALVSQWLKDFYGNKGLTPPHPVYPFNENELRELGKEKPIVRKVLEECAKNWKVPGDAPIIIDPLHKVEVAFNKELAELEQTIDNYLEDSSTIADALRLGFQAIKGKTVERVEVERIEEVKVKNADKGYLHFRIVGKENGRVVKIVVAVVQESTARFVTAALSRLIDYQKFDMTRGCLVRAKEVKPNTLGKEYLTKLLSRELGGEFVRLKCEDIKPLLAILFVNIACEDYEVSEDQINQFIVQNRIATDNYLIRDILSDPSGQLPSGLVEEDSFVQSKPASNKTDSDKIDEALNTLLSQLN